MKLFTFAVLIFCLSLQSAPVSFGNYFGFVVLNDKSVWAFGQNDHGQLGLGHRNLVQGLEQIPVLTNIISVVAGAGSSIALDGDGVIWFWVVDKLMVPQQLRIAQKFTSITGCFSIENSKRGLADFLAVDIEGRVWEFGDSLLQKVLESDDSSFHLDNFLRKLAVIEGGCVAISMDESSTMVLDEKGFVYFWKPSMIVRQYLSRTSTTPTIIKNLADISFINSGFYAFAGNGESVFSWEYRTNKKGRPASFQNDTNKKPSDTVFQEMSRPPKKIIFMTYLYKSFALDSEGKLWHFTKESGWEIIQGLPTFVSACEVRGGFLFLHPTGTKPRHGLWAIDEAGKVWLINSVFPYHGDTIIPLDTYLGTDFTVAIPPKNEGRG